jgi:hypothetical protein
MKLMKNKNIRYELFAHLNSKYNIVLNDSELDEIAFIALEFFLKRLLEKIQDKEQEVLMSPVRFNGVHIKTINEIFEKYGIKTETKF